jgi:hypothetical protein
LLSYAQAPSPGVAGPVPDSAALIRPASVLLIDLVKNRFAHFPEVVDLRSTADIVSVANRQLMIGPMRHRSDFSSSRSFAFNSIRTVTVGTEAMFG